MWYSNIIEGITELSKVRSKDEAFVFISTDMSRVSISWEQLYAESKIFARALVDLGVQRGEVVAISLRTCPEWLYVMFGALLMGAVPGSLTFTYTDGSDVVALIERMKRCAVIVMDPGADEENWRIINSLVSKIKPDGSVNSENLCHVRHILVHDPEKKLKDVQTLNVFVSSYLDDISLPEFKSEDARYLFQTSGSTGVPKLVEHSNDSLEMRVKGFFDDDGGKKITFNDRPFTWGGGFPFNAMNGDTRVTISGFGPEPTNRSKFVVSVIQQERCDTVCTFPPEILEWTSKHDELAHGKMICKTLVTGGQPTTKALVRCVGKICCSLVISYGSTETLAVSALTITDPESYEDYDSGEVIAGVEAKIMDENDAKVPDGVIGEIHIRSRNMFRGYLNDPEKTNRVLSEDGWYRSGDKGKLINNSLYVEGRKSFEIIRAGMNIAPEILEKALKMCPLVEDVAVVPIPHPELYQEICACVIPKSDTKDTENEIKSYLKSFHADSKRQFSYLPAVYIFMERFPITSTGKVSRPELCRLVKARF